MSVVHTPTDQLIAIALRDAERESVHGEITIWEDPNCGGLAWSRWEEDYCQSGGIGLDSEQYGDRFDREGEGNDVYRANLTAVIRALLAEGYEVQQ